MVKNLPTNAGDTDMGSVPESGNSSGEGKAAHSSTLAWRIPWTEEPGGLQSIGSQRDTAEHSLSPACSETMYSAVWY